MLGIDEQAFDVILASKSPRRLQLLEQLGVKALVRSADIDESFMGGESPEEYVRRLAKEKAEVVALTVDDCSLPVLAADTIVECDGVLLGKPANKDQALVMWRTLSGRYHHVHTGIALLYRGECFQSLSSSKVLFKTLSLAEMLAYWETGEPSDKAGGYAIQGLAASWVREIQGSYSSIMGLDLYSCSQMLEEVGVSILT